MPRTATGTNMRVMTATREMPLPKAKPEGPLGQRLASGASDLALNAASIGREALEDFRRSDRFFKYKVLIVAAWAVLSTTSMGIACQGAGDPTLDFGAKVVVLTGQRPAVMISNKSDEPWLDVTLIVNGDYRASVARVEPGKDVTITPKQLLGPDGKVAPADLVFRHVVMRTDDGKATLVEDGKVPE